MYNRMYRCAPHSDQCHPAGPRTAVRPIISTSPGAGARGSLILDALRTGYHTQRHIHGARTGYKAGPALGYARYGDARAESTSSGGIYLIPEAAEPKTRVRTAPAPPCRTLDVGFRGPKGPSLTSQSCDRDQMTSLYHVTSLGERGRGVLFGPVTRRAVGGVMCDCNRTGAV